MLSELTITIVIFSILVFLNSLPRGVLISNVFLAVLFMFAFPNIDQKLATFYALMLLFIFIFSILNFGVEDTQKITFGSITVKGVNIPLFEIVLGVALFGFMTFLSTRNPTTGAIIGVPQTLAVATSFSASLIMSLAFIENRFFLGLFNFYDKFLSPVVRLFPLEQTITETPHFAFCFSMNERR